MKEFNNNIYLLQLGCYPVAVVCVFKMCCLELWILLYILLLIIKYIYI